MSERKKESIIKPLCFCVFLLMLTDIWADTSERVIGRISSIIQKYDASLACTENDTPWYICHYLLAFGEESFILTSNGRMKAIPYLVFQAHHENGKPVFAKQSDGSLLPVTSPFPTRQYQDHRNQFLAIFVQVSGTDLDVKQPPQGIPDELWHEMLVGAWHDYNLEEDPSWTLLTYVNCFWMLPAEPPNIVSRIRSILEILTDPNSDVPLACEGTHALHAMAVYLKSPCSNLVSQELNDRVRHRLEFASANIPTYNEKTKENGMFGHRYLSLLERDMLIMEQYGHHLEWLVEFLPLSSLRSEEILSLIENLCCSLERCQNMRLKGHGGLCHSIHALRIYANRIKGELK